MATTAVHQLALKLVERCDYLGLKGKKRDDECLAYWVGAAQAADITGQKELAKILATQASLIVAVRGFIGIKEIQKATFVQPEPASVAAEPAPKAKGTVIKSTMQAGDHRTGGIKGLSAADIKKILGFSANVPDDSCKVKYSWGFTVNGERCGVWDYYGSHRNNEWSTFGPDAALKKVFGEAYTAG